jgi:predicted small lipoprotein YifL
MRAEYRSKLQVAVILMMLLGALGCGQKGPLRQPDAPPANAAAMKPASIDRAGDPSTLSARRENPHE